jgi:hypothetical protein
MTWTAKKEARTIEQRLAEEVGLSAGCRNRERGRAVESQLEL